MLRGAGCTAQEFMTRLQAYDPLKDALFLKNIYVGGQRVVEYMVRPIDFHWRSSAYPPDDATDEPTDEPTDSTTTLKAALGSTAFKWNNAQTLALLRAMKDRKWSRLSPPQGSDIIRHIPQALRDVRTRGAIDARMSHIVNEVLRSDADLDRLIDFLTILPPERTCRLTHQGRVIFRTPAKRKREASQEARARNDASVAPPAKRRALAPTSRRREDNDDQSLVGAVTETMRTLETRLVQLKRELSPGTCKDLELGEMAQAIRTLKTQLIDTFEDVRQTRVAIVAQSTI
jgi:hypothetical protein